MISSYPPPRCIRLFKTCLILFVILLVSFCFFMIIMTAASGSQNHRRRFRGKPLTLEEEIEKRSVCEKWAEFFPGNSTNQTVAEICDKYLLKKTDYYRLREHKVAPYNHSFIIKGDAICNANTNTIILVHSLHTYTKRRLAIRNTWGGAAVTSQWPTTNQLHDRIRLAFVFGVHSNSSMNREVERESKRFGDIIQGDFMESYRNMTLKSLLGLKWVHEYCPSAQYLIKSDDDMILNMPALMTVIHRYNMSWSIMGPLNRGARVLHSGKWKLLPSDFPFHFFPPYESGSAYVIGADLVHPLFTASEYVPHIFIDDVYITGILGQILNITHIKQKGFAYWVDKKPQVCDMLDNRILTGTGITPEYMISLWKQMKSRQFCFGDPSLSLI